MMYNDKVADDYVREVVGAEATTEDWFVDHEEDTLAVHLKKGNNYSSTRVVPMDEVREWHEKKQKRQMS